MKKILLSIIVTMLVMLVIGNGLGLVYLSYKCDKAEKELYNLKLSLASKGVVDIEDEINENVTIEENSTPKSDKVENIEDNDEYKKYIKLGLADVDKVADELPNYYAAVAFEEIVKCDFYELKGIDWKEDKEVTVEESKEDLEKIIEDVPKEIFEIVNSSDDIDEKIEKLEEYGYLAYPVINNINNAFKEDAEIKFDNCKLDEEISMKQIKKLREFENDMDLNDEEKEALEKLF